MSFLYLRKPTQRRHPRANLRESFVVAWQTDGRRDASPARNLSFGGIYIGTRDPLAVGTSLQLTFDTPQGEVRGRAIVRSSRLGSGMGVQFQSLDFTARRRLNDFMFQLLPRAEQASLN